MTPLHVTLLSLAYVLPLAALGLYVSSNRFRRRWLLVGVLTVLPLFYGTHYLLIKSLQGWPSDEPLPDTFELVSFDVVEPTLSTGSREDGHILMWVREAPGATPRVHRLVYRRVLHESLNQAAKRQAKGEVQLGRRVERSAAKSATSGGQKRPLIDFRSRPPPRLPEKG